MIRIAFSFDAGRYHATPWGHHVNEGVVEWPPSPWRILRGLLATGFSKLGWNEAALPEELEPLMESLAGCLPSFALPAGTLAHSRHYMPTRDKTTKVLDTFAHLGREEVFVFLPVELPTEQRKLLSELLGAMSYLGRAESWVTARVVAEDEAVPEPNCWPCAEGEGPSPGKEQTAVLSPARAEEYLAWREAVFPEALAEAAQGKKLSKKKRADLEAIYPESLLACLLTRTSTIQAAGWSQAPGSRKVLYWIESGLLRASQPESRARVRSGKRHEYALLALHSDAEGAQVLPRLNRALPQCEILHEALVRWVSKRVGDDRNCSTLR